MTCGIYVITHIASGRMYVGQSIDIEERFKQHAKGKGGCGALSGAIAKHGWCAFDARVLEKCERAALNEREARWVDELATMHPRGFNLVGGGGQSRQVTDDCRRRISEGTRRGLTADVIEQRASKLRGVPKSIEHRAKIAAAKRNDEANRERITAMARNQSADTRAKIAASKRGCHVSDETRNLISEAAKSDNRAARLRASPGYMSAATRQKMSEAAKRRIQRQRDQNGRFA